MKTWLVIIVLDNTYKYEMTISHPGPIHIVIQDAIEQISMHESIDVTNQVNRVEALSI